MRTQRFGIEIEMTGITREKAAEAIAEYFGTESFYIGTYYCCAPFSMTCSYPG